MRTKKHWNLITVLSLCAVVVLLAFYCPAQARAVAPAEYNGRIIDSIEIAGNVHVSVEKILSATKSKAGQQFSADEAEKDVSRIATIKDIDFAYYSTELVGDKMKLTFVVKEKTVIQLLIQAAGDGNLPAVQTLLKNGADVNAKDNGRTALIMASWHGHMEVVKLLLKKGADVNANTDGFTALMMAAQCGHTEIVKLLLKKGADVNAKANDGKTALGIAKQMGRTDIVQLLEKAGAKE